MQQRKNLILLYGGKSSEHEISQRSAASVLAHLNSDNYKITPIGMDKDGRCYLNDYQELLSYKDVLPVITNNSRHLDSLISQGKMAVDADVVFPIVHGPLYEDGCLQGLLSLADVAYVGSDVLSSAIGMDKDIQRRLACVDGVKSAAYRVFHWRNDTAHINTFCQQAVHELGWPLFVKPCSMGSSVGIHKVHTLDELLEAIDDARRYDNTVVVEECIHGREIELAVLENVANYDSPKVSIPGEIRVNHPDGFYSYAAKYLESDSTDLLIPAPLDEAIIERLKHVAAAIFLRLKCRGMARVDFFVNTDSGDIYFNEINTLPGFTTISMYPKLWQASGLSYPMLLDQLIELSLINYKLRQQLVTHYQ